MAALAAFIHSPPSGCALQKSWGSTDASKICEETALSLHSSFVQTSLTAASISPRSVTGSFSNNACRTTPRMPSASSSSMHMPGIFGAQAPTQARSAEADVMGLLLRQRIVFLGAQMDDFVADAIVSQLLLLDAQDANKDIRLFVNSPGGSISASMAIFDAIQLCRADVSTIAFGLAASTASIILMGGTKGKRYAMPNARIMMHQPLGGASGQAIDVEIQAKEIMYHKDNLTRIIAQITGRSYEQVEKDIDRDRYMSPVEAMEYGVIDGVIDEESILPLLPSPERVKPKKELMDADKNPRKFLIPTIPDDEIF
eukprot:TRINITY_DN2466_c0_g1_i1.p1 TRINITY_DN2466_c0_g1~~TRINITY_DN2466_c0_g1_i1.p1  ORF type:complete len:332 (+),score=53.29 TRINITY_DN2466_c0_g1_i1:60-998(+)